MSNLAIVGLYFLQNAGSLFKSIDHIIDNDIRTKGEFQLTDALQHMIDLGEPFSTFPVQGWYDCGKPETLPKTNFFIGCAVWIVMGSRVPVFGWHPIMPLACLGISFLFIWFYSVQKRRMRWSLIVGLIIVVAAFFYLLGVLLARWSILWPILLLLAGLLIPVWISLRDRRGTGAT